MTHSSVQVFRSNALPLKSSRAEGTFAWYAPALQESRRLPPEHCYPVMILEMSG